ncbi:E3 ubiquitin-protein ligase MSL2-like isoform X2 [Watersipora subatra]|uniref:E3 ubiquitin-protein ligase MSL2-like isoform X2 n=1 Tax=Watersipora subatra TaxID=2589382 RepID=UPI00355C0E7F
MFAGIKNYLNMAAFGYYSNATQYVMDSHELNENYFILLQEALTPLRFYLSCRVCNKILQNPVSPDHTACQHTVCRTCVGGKMRLKPSCGWCKNYDNFIDNKSLTVLIRCYKKLCEYIASSSDYRNQIAFSIKSGNSSVDNAKEKIASLLKEGAEAEIVTIQGETTPKSLPLNTNDDLVTLNSSRADTQSQSSPSIKGDLKLKLIIPSPKRRHWYAAASNHQSKVARKKLSLSRKSYPDSPHTTSLDLLLNPSGSSQKNVEGQATSRNESDAHSASQPATLDRYRSCQFTEP